MQNKFREFFRGLERNYGFCDLTNAKVNPETGKLDIPTKSYGWSGKPITDQDYFDHLDGKKSIGIQPCNDENKVIFGAIDVDVYKGFDTPGMLKIIQEHELPIIPVKSKSGGWHLYIHFKEFVEADFARKFLKSLLFTLKLKPITEIYPKQTQLDGRNGNFINLPYFNKSERVAVNPDTGSEFSFEQYIKVVETNSYSRKELQNFTTKLTSTELTGGAEEFTDGPPCLQQLSKNKLDDGRDRFLYNYMVFSKKKYPEDWEDKVRFAAREYFKNDGKWTDRKVNEKIKSWQKQDTGYTCEDGVITEFCMQDVCFKRKFGKSSDNVVEWPMLSNLIKINFDEPEFELTVIYRDKNGDEQSKSMSLKKGDALLVQTDFRKQVMTQLGIYLPEIRKKDFSIIMKVLSDNIEEQAAPAGTSRNELLYQYVKEYISEPPATSAISFETGSPLIKGGLCYVVPEKMYSFFKTKDWKIDYERTMYILKKNFKIVFGKKIRYPKSKNQEESNPQVLCCEIISSKFEHEHAPVEIIEMEDQKDIM